MLLEADVRLPVVHTEADAAEDLRGVDELMEELRLTGAESVVWACGGGSAAGASGGWDTWESAHEQVRSLARKAGLPASSTTFAFVHAVRALGAERVACAVAEGPFTAFLREAGIEVVAALEGGVPETSEQMLELARAADHPDAEAVLLPDPALLTTAYLPELEAALGKPVLMAHQVTVWEGLRLAERRARGAKLGRLFAARE